VDHMHIPPRSAQRRSFQRIEVSRTPRYRLERGLLSVAPNLAAMRCYA
jgi:hypothetical protein